MFLKCLIILIICSSFTAAQEFTELGRFGHKGRLNGEFNNPQAIAVSRDNTLYIVDTDNHRIQLFSYRGDFIKSIGGFGFKEDQFDSPRDIWVNSIINIYVSDYYNNRIQRYDKDMNFINSFKSNDGQDPEFQFAEVSSCLVTSQNDLFVLDHDEYKVIKYKRDGSAERSFGRLESGKGELNFPLQLELWSFDKILISDPKAKAIFIYDLFGNFIKKIVSNGFKYPSGIEADKNNNIYIADPEAKKIFFVNKRSQISEVTFIIPLTSPKDIVTTTINNKDYLYIIDENMIIFGTINFTKPHYGQ